MMELMPVKEMLPEETSEQSFPALSSPEFIVKSGELSRLHNENEYLGETLLYGIPPLSIGSGLSDECIKCGTLSFLAVHGRTRHIWQCEDQSNKILTHFVGYVRAIGRIKTIIYRNYLIYDHSGYQ